MISTRGRYAIRVLVDLAERRNGGYVPMKDVAGRQELSLKYMEQILPLLVRSGLIEGIHGKGGGYRLRREPEDISVWDVLTVTEGGGMAPVACLAEDAPACGRRGECRTIAMWEGYRRLTEDYFRGISLADLMRTEDGGSYVI